MKPRPKFSDEAVLRGAAELLLPRIMQWMDEPSEKGNEGEILEQLVQASKYADHDGYSIAKKLDRTFGWAPDSELVELLEDMFHERYTALDALTAEWVKETGIRPKHGIGESVTIQFRGKQYEGTVKSLYENLGRYAIHVPALGHVPDGEVGTQAILLNWEDVDGETPCEPNRITVQATMLGRELPPASLPAPAEGN